MAVIRGDSSAHVDQGAVGIIDSPSDLSAAKLSDTHINQLSAWDGDPESSAYRFTCDGATDYMRYEVGWNSTSTNGEADFTYRYTCGDYSPCVTSGSWLHFTGGTSSSDKGGGSYPNFDALQYQADANNGCFRSGYNRNGLLWVR